MRSRRSGAHLDPRGNAMTLSGVGNRAQRPVRAPKKRTFRTSDRASKIDREARTFKTEASAGASARARRIHARNPRSDPVCGSIWRDIARTAWRSNNRDYSILPWSAQSIRGSPLRLYTEHLYYTLAPHSPADLPPLPFRLSGARVPPPTSPIRGGGGWKPARTRPGQ